jgi:hypothetical protein
MTPTPEEIVAAESRARLWRRQQARRVQFQRQLWNSLAGSPSALRGLHLRWAPVVEYLRERDMPPSDDAVEVDPLGISDTTNVGL